MNSTKEKTRTIKNSTRDTKKSEPTQELNDVEKEPFSWQLKVIIGAFGIGTFILILKIFGLI